MGELFVVTSTYDERLVPKAAGFVWNKLVPGRWATKDASVAVRLLSHASEGARKVLEPIAARHVAAVEASRATAADVDVPAPAGLAYMPFQKAGIAYALDKPGVLIGDEMGLGKTIQAVGIINADPSIRRVLVICPASLKLNWRKELYKWLVRPLTVGIADGQNWPDRDVVVINYDVLKKWPQAIQAASWDLLIVDEAHYLKNPDAQRTVAVLGRAGKRGRGAKPAQEAIPGIAARRRVFLTGTPIVNRPLELWGLVSSLAPQVFKSFWTFVNRYCDAHQDHGGYWDFTGASHLDELQELLRANCMVRRLKSEVLTELPAKRRQVIELDLNSEGARMVQQEQAVLERAQARLEQLQADVELARAGDDEEAFREAVRALGQGVRSTFADLARVRHETALLKLPAVIEHLENTSGKVILFGYHHDVIEAVRDHFGAEVAVVYGPTTLVERDAAVTRFQTDPTCRLFVGSIDAAGVGLTLTASSHVVFAEEDWVPGKISQAEDRAHRIGQRESVLVQHLVLAGSLDARMANVLIDKQAVIEAALNSGDAEAGLLLREPLVPVMPGRQGGAVEQPVTARRRELDEVATNLTETQRTAIHFCLRYLAASDLDHARELNGFGFSKADTLIGCDLAGRQVLSPRQAALGLKIVRKYHRQLPPDMLADAKEASDEDADDRSGWNADAGGRLCRGMDGATQAVRGHSLGAGALPHGAGLHGTGRERGGDP